MSIWSVPDLKLDTVRIEVYVSNLKILKRADLQFHQNHSKGINLILKKTFVRLYFFDCRDDGGIEKQFIVDERQNPQDFAEGLDIRCEGGLGMKNLA